MKKNGVGFFLRCFATILVVIFLTSLMSLFLLYLLVWHNNSHALLNGYSSMCLQMEEKYKSLQEYDENAFVTNQDFVQYLQWYTDGDSCDFFIADQTGKIVLCSDVFSQNSEKNIYNNDSVCEIHREIFLTEETRKKIDASDTCFRGVSRSELCPENILCYVVAVSVETDDNSCLYFIIAEPLIEACISLLHEHGRIIIFAFLFSSLLALLTSWLASYHIFKPLQKITEAARRYSHGDYTYRISSHSRYREMKELTNAFNHLAECLAENEKSTQDFVANISHELKTPVTTINGFVDGILDGTIPPEKEKHYLQIVSDVCRRLTRLVVSMLNMAKIEAGKMEMVYSDFSLTGIVINTVLGFEKAISDKDIDVVGLDKLSDVHIRAEESLITQVVYNLIDNAVKYTPENGMIKIGLETDKRNATLNILNTGNAIPDNEVKNIFDRFYKSDKSRGLDTTGFGLGLHIVQSIVNMHGGTIKVTSQENEFINFIVILPL